MSEHINGDTGPKNLRNAMRIMRGEVHRMERVTRMRRKASITKGPRQYCAVCGSVFDMALIDPKAEITKSLCSECRQKLAQGYTACITADKYAFLKSEYFKANGMAGKIVPVSPEVFKSIEAKYVPKPKPPEPS